MEKKELIEETADATSAKEVESDTFKCPGCGNFLKYDPDSCKLKCDYCGGTREVPAPQPPMELYYTALSEQGYSSWGEVKCIQCPVCGAKTMLEKYQTVTVCPFCGAPNVVESDEVPGLKPNAVLPFLISEPKAHESLKKWMGKKFLAPSNLKKTAKTSKMRGVYVPSWTFDSNVFATYDARLGKTYTVTVGSGKNRRTETRVRWYNVSGSINSYFDDVLVNASSRLSQKDLNKIGGFDTKNSVQYEEEYLSGYSAERYAQGLDASWEVAKDLMINNVRSQIRNRYPDADRVDYINVRPVFNETKYKYVLGPVWTSAYRYKGKDYGFVVNGRNGRTVGKAPLSPIKTFFFVLFCAGAAALLIWLIYLLFFV